MTAKPAHKRRETKAEKGGWGVLRRGQKPGFYPPSSTIHQRGTCTHCVIVSDVVSREPPVSLGYVGGFVWLLLSAVDAVICSPL